MIVVIREAYNEDDYRTYVEFNSCKRYLSFCDGEPEDNTIARNFNDIWRIQNFIEEAYEAGKNDEGLQIQYKKVTWDEI